VAQLSGGPGNDALTLVLKVGWLNPQGQPRLTGLSAGYGDDNVRLTVRGRTPVFVDSTGDERDNPPSPLEGRNDRLTVVGPLDPTSSLIKYEQQTVRPASADEEVDAIVQEWMTDADWAPEEAQDSISPEETKMQLFLPLVTSEPTVMTMQNETLVSQPVVTETVGLTETLSLTATQGMTVTTPLTTELSAVTDASANATPTQVFLPLVTQ